MCPTVGAATSWRRTVCHLRILTTGTLVFFLHFFFWLLPSGRNGSAVAAAVAQVWAWLTEPQNAPICAISSVPNNNNNNNSSSSSSICLIMRSAFVIYRGRFVRPFYALLMAPVCLFVWFGVF